MVPERLTKMGSGSSKVRLERMGVAGYPLCTEKILDEYWDHTICLDSGILQTYFFRQTLLKKFYSRS